MTRRAFAAGVLALTCVGVAAAQDAGALATPHGRVLLTVTGKIVRTNRNRAAVFDLAMIRALGTHTVKTSTPWTKGVNTFEGVLLRDLIADVGAGGHGIRVVALNDYKVDIPASDYMRNNVIVAYKQNGRILRIRDKGPLWIIYPWDSVPQLREEETYARSIWQIDRIQVK